MRLACPGTTPGGVLPLGSGGGFGLAVGSLGGTGLEAGRLGAGEGLAEAGGGLLLLLGPGTKGADLARGGPEALGGAP